MRSEDVIFKQEFRAKLAVKDAARHGGRLEFVSVTLEGSNFEQIPGWLNKFVQLADEKTIFAQKHSLEMKVKRVKGRVAEKISSLRSVEKSKRLDLIARLGVCRT